MFNTLTSLATAAIILSKDKQLALVKEFQNSNDQESLTKLVGSNIRLAHKVAKKHVRNGLSFEDLLSQATEGILIAAAKFDASKEASFTTYARMWMTAKCQEHVQANAGMVHCGSRTAKKLWSGLQKARKVVGVDATPAQLAAHMDLKVKDVEDCLRFMSARGMSMDAPLNADGGTIATLIPDGKMGQDERMERTQAADRVRKAIAAFAAGLNDRHRAIFAGRIANEVMGTEKRSATSFGCTKQRVGQIEKNLRAKFATHLTSSFGTEAIRGMMGRF